MTEINANIDKDVFYLYWAMYNVHSVIYDLRVLK